MATQRETWQVTVNHIVSNMIRSQSIIVDAPDHESAKAEALKIANEKGWDKPRVTRAKVY